MNKIRFIILLLLVTTVSTARTTYFSSLGIVIAVADSADGARLSLKSDEYTRSLTPFDLSIRLHKTGLKEKDYLTASARDLRNWTVDEMGQLQDAVNGIDVYLKEHAMTLKLPDTVVFMKTTAESEFGAEGWTRANRIMLNQESPVSLHLVAHELFHVLSRHDVKTRDAVYLVFDFKPCNNIEYKKAMNNRVITNPDCPFLMHYVTPIIADGVLVEGALILYSKKDYKPEYTMNDYAAIGFLEVTGEDSDKKPLIRNGEPVIYDLDEIPHLFDHIGTNTQYVLHIEEICAEHFAALVGGKEMNQQELLDNFGKALKAR